MDPPPCCLEGCRHRASAPPSSVHSPRSTTARPVSSYNSCASTCSKTGHSGPNNGGPKAASPATVEAGGLAQAAAPPFTSSTAPPPPPAASRLCCGRASSASKGPSMPCRRATQPHSKAVKSGPSALACRDSGANRRPSTASQITWASAAASIAGPAAFVIAPLLVAPAAPTAPAATVVA
ncbi:hypothetical protein Vretifemale_18579, partial [Volvox reticuliferus]